jgi:hypothetical protein
MNVDHFEMVEDMGLKSLVTGSKVIRSTQTDENMEKRTVRQDNDLTSLTFLLSNVR